MYLEQIKNNRDYYVVKNNDLIQKSRYSLGTQEQKIILYLISKIQPDDDKLKLYEFKITEFCEVCGIEKDSGQNYASLRNAIQNLSDKSMWVTINDHGRQTLVRWIEKPYIDPHSGTIEIKLDEDLKPYLLQLKENFTQYSYLYILAMRSKYSIRLFEILRSYMNLRKWTVDLDDLRVRLSAESYSRNFDFVRKVIDTALVEINKYSDITVTPKYIKKGRKVNQIEFTIKQKTDLMDRLKTWVDIEEEIDD